MRPTAATARPRTGAGTCAQARCASRAARHAATKVPASPRATSATTSSSRAGLTEGSVPPGAPSIGRPSTTEETFKVAASLFAVTCRPTIRRTRRRPGVELQEIVPQPITPRARRAPVPRQPAAAALAILGRAVLPLRLRPKTLAHLGEGGRHGVTQRARRLLGLLAELGVADRIAQRCERLIKRVPQLPQRGLHLAPVLRRGLPGLGLLLVMPPHVLSQVGEVLPNPVPCLPAVSHRCSSVCWHADSLHARVASQPEHTAASRVRWPPCRIGQSWRIIPHRQTTQMANAGTSSNARADQPGTRAAGGQPTEPIRCTTCAPCVCVSGCRSPLPPSSGAAGSGSSS